MNCWEFWGCGREPGGDNVDEAGLCPATTEKRLDGIHGGKNAGRACWAISETLCPTRVGGPEAGRANCLLCPFYDRVLEEEICEKKGKHFTFTSELLSKLEAPDDEYLQLGENVPFKSLSTLR